MNRRNLVVAALIVLFLAAGAWALGYLGGEDRAVAELQQMADQAFNRDLPDAQQAQFRDQFRERMGALSDEQRDAFFDANRDRWMQRVEERMNEFFAMSPADQQKRLDEIINQMTQPREGRGTNSDGNRGAPDGDRARGDGRGRGDWANMSEAQRDERAKRRLDRTSPKMRAQFTEFRKKLEDRATERGISQLPDWGRGPRG